MLRLLIVALLFSSAPYAKKTKECGEGFASFAARNSNESLKSTSEFRPVKKPKINSWEGHWLVNTNSGKLYLVRTYNDSGERIKVEHLVNRLYEAMQVKVPPTQLREFNGRPSIFIEEPWRTTFNSAPPKPGELKKTDLADGFIVDAWLGNRNLDGVLLAGDGRAIRVNNGHALGWEVTGGKQALPSTIDEILQPNGNKFLGSLTAAELAGQIRKFSGNYLNARDRIQSLIAQSGLSTASRKQLSEALEKRAFWLMDNALPELEKRSLKAMNEEEMRSQEIRGMIGKENWNRALIHRRWAQKNGLTDGELAALGAYTQESGYSYLLNNFLRGNLPGWKLSRGENLNYQEIAYSPYINLIRSGLKKLPDFRGRVFRGISADVKQLKQYQPGAVVHEQSFFSSSKSQAFPGNVQFEIQSKRGKHVGPLNNKDSEDEVMFLPGTKFKVLSKHFDKEEKVWRIRLVEQ